MLKHIWLNIKSFWYLVLVMFGTMGVMFGMGMGPTVNPRIISLLLIVACSLLGVIAIFLHFSQNYANKREKELEVTKAALRDSQAQKSALQSSFQETINTFSRQLQAWEKKFQESNLPAPTKEELWRAEHFETPEPAKQIKAWQKIKSWPLLRLKKLP